MKKIYCIISAFSKTPILNFDYGKLSETAMAQDYELEFITIAPESVIINNPTGKVMLFNDKYTHNQAMSEVIPTIPDGVDGMIVLDSKYASDYSLVSNMFLELKNGANIIHVKRKRNNYLDRVFEYSLKFFNVINRMITGSNDNNYIRTLHLVDKSVLLLLKYFPTKYGIFCEADFLANCKVSTLFVNEKYELAKQRKANVIKPLIGIFFMLAGIASFVLTVTLSLGLDFIIWMLTACITFIIGGGTYLCYAIIDYKIKTSPKLKDKEVNKEQIAMVMENQVSNEETKEDKQEETTIEPIDEQVEVIEDSSADVEVEEPTEEVVVEDIIEVVEENETANEVKQEKPKPTTKNSVTNKGNSNNKKTTSAKKGSAQKTTTKKGTSTKKSSTQKTTTKKSTANKKAK